ncbi:cache domain-containing protein, partial [Spirochaetota bacterium]
MKIFNKLEVKIRDLLILIIFTGILALSVIISSIIEIGTKRELVTAAKNLQAICIKTYHTVSRTEMSSIAERTKALANYYYIQYENGSLKEKKAKKAILDALRNAEYNRLGEIGYIMVVDSQGLVKMHPRLSEDADLSSDSTIEKAIEMQNGYFEYILLDSRDNIEKDIAVSVSYFEPFDYYIIAKRFKSDFTDRVLLEARKLFPLLKVGETGFTFIIDNEGTFLVHPEAEGGNKIEEAPYIREMLEKKGGYLRYRSAETKKRKTVSYKYLLVFDWIVALEASEKEFYFYFRLFRILLLVLSAVFIIFIILTRTGAVKYIKMPIQEILDHINAVGSGDLSAVIELEEQGDAGKIISALNDMTGNLN